MQKTNNERLKKVRERLKNIVLPVIAYGGLAGIISGILVGFFNFFARYLIQYSELIYKAVLSHLWALPLFFLGLAGLAILMAVLHKYIPNVRGSGIPNVEGSVRGYLSYKSGRTLFGTFVGAFMSYVAGLPLGSEGPSVQIGAMTSQGITELMKAKLTWRRYVMAGGAGAGIAVAFNAPLTGIIFAMEECQKRWSPITLLCASSAVIFGTATFRTMGMIIKDVKWSSTATLFDIENLLPLGDLADVSKFGEFAGVMGLLALMGIILGVLAVAFNFLLVRSQRLTDKWVNKFPYWARLLVAFLMTGVLGLIFTKYFDEGFSFVNTGGHSLIDNLCHDGVKYSILLLLTIIVVRMVLVLLCFNSGATGGLFIPMLAMGALAGAVIGKVFIAMGMNAEYFPALVLISMTTFFAASVRAPITAVVLIMELSGYDSDFLPVVIAIFTAFLVAELIGNTPLYDSLLERLREQNNKEEKVVKRSFGVVIEHGAFVVGRRIKDIIWPADGLVTELVKEEGESIVPDGETVMEEGDKLTLVVESNNYKETVEYISHLVKGPYDRGGDSSDNDKSSDKKAKRRQKAKSSSDTSQGGYDANGVQKENPAEEAALSDKSDNKTLETDNDGNDI